MSEDDENVAYVLWWREGTITGIIRVYEDREAAENDRIMLEAFGGDDKVFSVTRVPHFL